MCTQPWTRHRVIAGKHYYDVLPCGKCAECIRQKQNGYIVRCIQSAKDIGNCWFFTLTYNENAVPKVSFVDCATSELVLINSLRRDDVKKWKREVRKRYYRWYGKKFPDFSYLICGEYGPKTKRPHYHGVLFGLCKKDVDFLMEYWSENYGFVQYDHIPEVSLSSGHDDISCVARYVGKYCVKLDDSRYSLERLGIVEKPRIQTSIGFGLPADFEGFKDRILLGVDDIHSWRPSSKINKINSRCNYVYNGFKYSLPSYYRKKIFYEKNYKGNLVASPLSKLCSRTLRDNSIEDFNRELRRIYTEYPEREADKMALRLTESQTSSLQSREDSKRKDLLDFIKRTKF